MSDHAGKCKCSSCTWFDDFHKAREIKLEDIDPSYAAWKRIRAEEKSWWRAVYRHWVWTMLHGKR